MQNRLMFALFFVIGTSLMGGFITAALSLGLTTAKPILIAALACFLLSVPVSWLVTRSILKIVR